MFSGKRLRISVGKLARKAPSSISSGGVGVGFGFNRGGGGASPSFGLDPLVDTGDWTGVGVGIGEAVLLGTWLTVFTGSGVGVGIGLTGTVCVVRRGRPS